MLCGYGRIMLAAAWHLYGHSHSNLPDVPLALSYGYWRRFRRFPPWHFNESRYDYCLGCNPQGASTRRCAAVVELTRHPQLRYRKFTVVNHLVFSGLQVRVSLRKRVVFS
jgi:hypothetical protein